MKILALEHELPGATPEKFQQYGRGEAMQVWQLYQEGFIRESYFRADRRQAVLGLECENVEAARAGLTRLPFVAHQLIAFELIPLHPYPGFARLFAPSEGVTGENE